MDMKVCLQLYSLAKHGVKGLEELLKQSSEIGYDGVELLKHDNSAEETVKLLKKYGLYAPSAHIGKEYLEKNFNEILEFHKKIGAEYVIIPWESYEDNKLRETIDFLNKASVEAKSYGLKVGYHNHSHEFKKIDGKYIIDHLFENTNEDVVFELDVYWIYKGGEDPIKYIEKFGKRVQLVHLKQSNSEKENVDFPDGILDMKKIIEAAKYANHFIVEQETYKISPFVSCKADVDYLKSI